MCYRTSSASFLGTGRPKEQTQKLKNTDANTVPPFLFDQLTFVLTSPTLIMKFNAFFPPSKFKSLPSLRKGTKAYHRWHSKTTQFLKLQFTNASVVFIFLFSIWPKYLFARGYCGGLNCCQLLPSMNLPFRCLSPLCPTSDKPLLLCCCSMPKKIKGVIVSFPLPFVCRLQQTCLSFYVGAAPKIPKLWSWLGSPGPNTMQNNKAKF